MNILKTQSSFRGIAEPFDSGIRLQKNCTTRLTCKGEYILRIHWLLLTLLFLLALASCTSPQGESIQSPPQEALPEKPSPTPTENPLQLLRDTPESTEMPSNSPPVEKFVSLAKKDLAERLKIAADEINLVKTAEMTWPDSALGCPSPGKVYAQGRVPGYQIRLEAKGAEYVYNTDLRGTVLLCPQNDPDHPDSNAPLTPGPTSQIGVPIK